MIRKCLGLALVAAVCSFPVASSAQQAATAGTSGVNSANTVVPKLVTYNGLLADLNGKPLTGAVGVTFYLYKDAQGGAPLWMETQNVQPNKTGHYSVMLGSTTSQGLPEDVFVSGEARWLGVQASGQPEQPRVLLVAVPYALKARDAETIGGLPPSAFMLAPAASSGNAVISAAASETGALAPNAAVTGAGTTGQLPLWDSASDIVSSVVTQTGSGSTARIGINTATPTAVLDVKGAGTFRGTLGLPSTGAATTAAGKNSYSLLLSGTAFNSGTGTSVSQNFRLQTEPAGNNTTNASGTLNLLYASGTNAAAETGFKIASNGRVTFAAGQTFPGAGTVTSVGSGSGLTGGPITGSGSLSIAGGGVTNSMLQNPSLTVTTVSPLTGGGAVSLGGTTSLGLTSCASGQILKWNGSWACATDNNSGGSVTSVASGTGLTGGPITSSGTLSVNPAVVPELALANTFTNSQAVTLSSSNSGITVTNAGSGYGVTSNVTDSSTYNVLAQGGFEGLTANYQTFPIVGVTNTGPTAIDGISNYGTADGDAAIVGLTYALSGTVYGVLGSADGSPDGSGVYGQMTAGVGQSVTGSEWNSGGAGVWGDGGAASHYGVVGTADNRSGVVAYNNSSQFYTLYASNGNNSGFPFGAYTAQGKGCQIDPSGNINCTGAKNAVVPIEGGQRKVALAAIESPKNWFEDFGADQLSNGAAIIRLEPVFAETVNTEVDYHVFLTPNGDCKGLYISRKTPSAFEVRELGGGTSSVSFDYRIVALRRNYEDVRLADHTHDLGPVETPARTTPLHIDMRRMIPPSAAQSIPTVSHRGQ